MTMKIGVVGAGAWGTALAVAMRRSGAEVWLWAREAEVVEAINQIGINSPFLPELPLNPKPQATPNLADLSESDLILMVTPAQHMATVLRDLQPHLKPVAPLLICSKGIERDRGRLLSEILEETCPNQPYGILTGPTFAAETARGLPTALTLAMADEATGQALLSAIGSRNFRPYYAPDVIGAQIGGAVKNVLAIACGITQGLGVGENARAALIARGLEEMTRFAVALGGKRETLMGLSGLGDLCLTCNSLQSRNMSFGHALGQGQSITEILDSRHSVTEGFYTSSAVIKRAAEAGVEMPICAVMDQVLNHALPVPNAMEMLLSRPFGSEVE